MKIRSAGNTLYIDNGVGGSYEMAISEISEWKLVAKENGAVYLSFFLDGCTQHVSVVTSDSVELERDIRDLSYHLNKEPLLNLKSSRLPSKLNRYSSNITIEVLAAVLAVSSGC